jgi:chromosome segregation ATPase
MERKTKFIVLGLAGLSVIFVFLYIQTLGSKQLVLRERDDLKKENITLVGKLDKLRENIRDYENKIGLLNNDLDKVSRENQELERKFELASKERAELVERLKSRPAQAAQSQAPPDTDAYWAGILKEKTDLELQLGNLRGELRTAQITNEELQREKSVVELDVNSLKRDNEDLKRQLEYNQKVMDSVSQELVREKNDKIKIQDTFKLIKNENTLLMRQLKSLNERKVNLEKKLQGLQEKNEALERKFTEMQTMLTDKISKIDDLKDRLDTIRSGSADKAEAPQEKKESVELPAIVVRPQQTETPSAEAPAGALTGKILAVNKDTNFVIIDLGEEAGIKIGDSFQVYREAKPIASIVVIQTRRNIAACDIKKETTPIKVGDTIR